MPDPDRARIEKKSESANRRTRVRRVRGRSGAGARTRESRLPPLPSHLRLVSVTIAGNSRQIIGPALESVVDWVDVCLVVDTGITDDTLEIARDIAGDKLVVRQFTWRSDFSAARNFALAAAAETGSDWAIMLDTDERVLANDIDIRGFLATTDQDALLAIMGHRAYAKDRFFRLPVHGEFVGPVHEAYIQIKTGGGAEVEIPDFLVDELAKTPEQLRLKFERDAEILRHYIAAHPDEPRWLYYLGDCLAGLDRLEEAIGAFRGCAALRGWREEGAWALYRVARSLHALGRYDEALLACAEGMTIYPGMSELPWFAGVIALRKGDYIAAIAWARISIAVGPTSESALLTTRVAWRHLFGQWDGPYDVLALAYHELGDIQGEEEAKRLLKDAAAMRESLERLST